MNIILVRPEGKLRGIILRLGRIVLAFTILGKPSPSPRRGRGPLIKWEVLNHA